MTYPFQRTARSDWLNAVRDDLQVGQQVHGVFIGFERRYGDWGPEAGEVAAILVRECRTGDLLSVPVLARELQRHLLDRMPQLGQSVTLTCTGTLELEVTAWGPAAGFEIVSDPSEPVPDPPDGDLDESARGKPRVRVGTTCADTRQ